MCPACTATADLIVAGATSAGGLTARAAHVPNGASARLVDKLIERVDERVVGHGPGRLPHFGVSSTNNKGLDPFRIYQTGGTNASADAFRLLPHGQLAGVPGTDHWAPVQRHDWVISRIEAFLDARMPKAM